MAYNFQPLICILEQILDPQQTRWVVVDDNKPQLQSILEKSGSLKQILEKSSVSDIENFESEIRDAAHKVEDIIESHMVDQILSSPGAVSFTFHIPDLQQVIEELDSVMEKVVKLTERSKVTTGFQRIMVGVDKDLLELKGRLLGMPSKLEVVPIVGMGGVGKTSIARKLYEDELIVSHFRHRAWTTVSRDYDIQAILVSILRCITGEEYYPNIHDLYWSLYWSLNHRRYLIVLDDIWSIKVWDEIKECLPDNNNGSRIVITTRKSEVAKHANSQSVEHQMQLLSGAASWDLLRQIVFGEEDCPATLERIGRNIAINCRGLPLAIQTIGGLLLSKANRTERLWENVANDVRVALAQPDETFSRILSLSYNGLPSRLKSCLLYMGAFPEYEIKASGLIRLWVAEGFLTSNGDKSLEEEAEDCLKALVDRNLVSVSAVKSNGRAMRYSMHDLMRDLCLRKAEELRFVHREVGVIEKDSTYRPRRVFVQSSYIFRDINPAAEFLSLVRSFVCTGPASRLDLSNRLSRLMLLRVLDVFYMEFDEFPREVLHMLNLRYLAFSYRDNSHAEIPSDITRLCNLQTLVLCFTSSAFNYITLPSEILQMSELRHVVVYGATIRISSGDWSSSGFVLEKLHTIYPVLSSQEFLHRIPNVKKLGIGDESSVFDLRHLHKLETLRFSSTYTKALVSPSALKLPLSLKKLSLVNCKIVGKFMNYLCELPNLEVLKFQYCKFECGGNRQEWDATEQEFCKLKFLLFERVKLLRWRAYETTFPRLCHLVIRECPNLEKIPSGIGDIPTLQTIELDENCSYSLVASAERIIVEQCDNDNRDLQLRF